jgi:lysophospholipase
VRRSLPLLLCLLVALGACKAGDDPRAPFTDSRIPPGLEARFYPPQGWAWGLLKVGKAPAARYGVAAPGRTARDQIVILAAYGEPAEVWFETVSDLVDRGHVVWVLEPVGQSGSGHYAVPRDLIDAPSLDPDVATLLAFTAAVARGRPLFVISSGSSAPIAERAAELGLQADGLVLSAPLSGVPKASDTRTAERMTAIGLGALRAAGEKPWSSKAPDPGRARSDLDPARAALTLRWQQANPDLRMGGPSWRWRSAYLHEQIASERHRSDVRLPFMQIGSSAGRQATPGRRCADRCTVVELPPGAGRSPHLATDRTRDAWLDAIERFIDPAHAALAPAPAAATVDDQS